MPRALIEFGDVQSIHGSRGPRVFEWLEMSRAYKSKLRIDGETKSLVEHSDGTLSLTAPRRSII
jgi:hypothetical protein